MASIKPRLGLTAALRGAAQRPWMGVYLRIIAVFYLFGAFVHYANLLGFGEMPWARAPFSWKVLDLFYAPLDTLVVIGLWFRKPWGIAGLFVAVLSQCFLYSLFPHLFAFTEVHREGLQSMLVFHGLTLLTFFTLFIARR